ncbi:NADH pyrophosphatase [Rhodotorula mucilaginosa]|uniref:NAD(+) diphosphatase n=1 Tax=Rhodotorula mucilaginosa TaxID=5537 RepID=A0A9P6W2N1_RHOMI|nr:NADH pyrophosphatase [Rhodotorula mucilaginosa]
MQNYYAGSPLNRLSYLRSVPSFLASALESPKAKFIALDSLQPLCKDDKDGVRKLHYLKWKDVKDLVGPDPKHVFHGVDGKNEDDVPAMAVLGKPQQMQFRKAKVGELSAAEKRDYFLNQPALVFLGVDERSAPESAKSLPVSKPDENSTLETHSPHGDPYWAIDVSTFKHLKKRIMLEHGGAKVSCLGRPPIVAKLTNRTPPPPVYGATIGCADDAERGGFDRRRGEISHRLEHTESGELHFLKPVWAGWKRSCIPGEPASDGAEAEPACISRKGVHNFAYPRTDPVVIMAVLSPDRERILLGRQRTWPARFYSCLAGFIESGESLEEAVRREVYEEAGIVIGEVGYHSSQPWPFPSSLMFGCWGVAESATVDGDVRVDLDNELEDARFFTREQVLEVINSTKPMQLSREQVARLDGKEGAGGSEGVEEAKEKAKSEGSFLMPPATAIANTLVTAWATGKLFNQHPSGSSSPAAPATHKM